MHLPIFFTAVLLSIVASGSSTRRAERRRYRQERNVTRLVSTVEVNSIWGEFLLSAPSSVGLLGSLLVISGQDDFSLENSEPKDGFRHMQYPGSFRATLLQIATSGYNSFRVAHKNMDEIKNHVRRVPKLTTDAMSIMMGGLNAEQTENYLGDILFDVEQIGTRCVALSERSMNKFTGTMSLMNEVSNVFTNSQGLNGQEARRNALIYAKYEQELRGANQTQAMIKQKNAQLQHEVEKVQSDYDEAMEDIPVGWDLIAKSLVKGLIGSFLDFGKGITNLIPGIIGNKQQQPTNAQGQATLTPQQQKAFVFATTMLNPINSINQFLALQAAHQAVNSPDLDKEVDGISAIKIMWGMLKSDILQAVPELTNFDNIISQAEEMTIKLKAKESISEDYNRFKPLMDPVLTKLGQLKSTAEVNGNQPLPAAVPYPLSDYTGVDGNERYKAQVMHVMLLNAKDREFRNYEKMIENSEKISEMMGEMRSIDLTQIDIQKTIELLQKGIACLGRIQEQWSSLVSYFTKFANLVKVTFMTAVDEFTRHGDNNVDFTTASETLVNMLRKDTRHIYEMAAYLYQISSSYVEVSEKYLLQNLAKLNGLMALEGDGARSRALNEIMETSEENKISVAELLESKRRSFRQSVDRAAAEIERHLERTMVSNGEEDVIAQSVIEENRLSHQTREPDQKSIFAVIEEADKETEEFAEFR